MGVKKHIILKNKGVFFFFFPDGRKSPGKIIKILSKPWRILFFPESNNLCEKKKGGHLISREGGV